MKPAISAKSTYVLDADELDRLGDLSLTTVIADMADSVEQATQVPTLRWPEDAAAETQSDRTINELLAGAFSASDEPPAGEVRAPYTEQVERAGKETGDLLAPELMFPELHLKR